MHHYCHIFDNFVHFSFFFGLKYMNAFNVRERNNAKTCQTFKQLSKLSLFVCSLRLRVKYKYKKEKILRTENKITSNNCPSDLSLSTCSDLEKSKNTTWASRNSPSPPFPGMKVSDSRSWIMGLDFFFPFPIPEFQECFFSFPSHSRILGMFFSFPFCSLILGMGFFHSLPVPEL